METTTIELDFGPEDIAILKSIVQNRFINALDEPSQEVFYLLVEEKGIEYALGSALLNSVFVEALDRAFRLNKP